MSLRRILGIALILALLGPLLILAGSFLERELLVQLGADCLVLAVLWLVFFALRRLFQKLLFRVGNRLFVSYLLIGLVPVLLIFLLAGVLLYLLTGQLAVRRVEREMQAAVGELRATAAAMSGELELGADAAARRAAFARHSHSLPGRGWAMRPLTGGIDGEGPLEAALLLPEGRVHTSFEAVGRLAGTHFLAVVAPPTSAGSLIVYQRIEPELRQEIERRGGLSLSFPQALAASAQEGQPFQLDIGDKSMQFRIDPDQAGQKAFEKDPERVEGSGFFGRPFVYFPRAVELPYVDWADPDWHFAIESESVEGDNHRFNLVAQTSMAREYVALFDSAAADNLNLSIGKGAVAVPFYLSVTIAILYFLAAGIASMLVYRIARATSSLYRGFGEVEKGNYDVALTLRGRDQLAGLVQSFNRMARHLGQALEERAEREAIERELGIARQLQRSLLPSADFRAPGFEIAADFVPAAAIGGDFYHFTRWSDDRLLVAIADVSGHGLSTGIVMSAAKALLSALANDYCPCPELLRRLDRELRSHTGRRHFVTLGLAAFDLARGEVELTNAGHPYPYRLEQGGTLTALENPSRPLAVGLPQDFRCVPSPVTPGDLWIFYSDGVIEAMSPAGEVFGFERFEDLLKTCAGKSAAETRDCVLAAWKDFAGTDCPEDDRTLLILRVLPA